MSMFLYILHIMFLLTSKILRKHIHTMQDTSYHFSQQPAADNSLGDPKKEAWSCRAMRQSQVSFFLRVTPFHRMVNMTLSFFAAYNRII